MKLNPVKTVSNLAHKNWMDGTSFDVKNPLTKLRLASASAFFGEPKYYGGGSTTDTTRYIYRTEKVSNLDRESMAKSLGGDTVREWLSTAPVDIMVNAIQEALNHDLEATLKMAVELRTVDQIRTTPQVILVMAANHPNSKGTGLVRKYGQEILARADEMTVQLAFQLAKYGKPIPMALRRLWGDKLNTFSSYQLAKYRQEKHEVKLVDVLNLAHGVKPNNQTLDQLVKGTLKTTGTTWESIISQGGSTKENWEKAIDVAGHMALLRNIRNMLNKGVDPDMFIDKLVSGAKTGKQLPFRYMSAYNAIKDHNPSGKIIDALDSCLEFSAVNNVPFLGKKVASLVDNSGSAHGQLTSEMGSMSVAQIANLMGTFVGLRADDGWVGVFGDNLEMVSIRKKASVLDQVTNLNKVGKTIGHSTENGIWLFWKDAINNKTHWDTVFIMSDMQAGHGGLYGKVPSDYREYTWSDHRCIDVNKLISKYRKDVNPDVKVFMIQMAGYTDTLVPEFYPNTYILSGWGPGVLQFAGKVINGQ